MFDLKRNSLNTNGQLPCISSIQLESDWIRVQETVAQLMELEAMELEAEELLTRFMVSVSPNDNNMVWDLRRTQQLLQKLKQT